MSAFVVLCALVVVAVAVEIAVPGRDVYHAGWFNVGLLAAGTVVVALARGAFRAARTNVARTAVAALVAGAAVTAVAGAASGLLAPDNRTIVGAPGQRVRVEDLRGSLVFPPFDANAIGATPAPVRLERAGRAVVPVGDRGRIAGNFRLQPQLRSVVFVDVRDANGGRLTVTQPAGSSFLSPVLLMQQRQTIAGFNVPYDSFAVPAAHRLVRVVLFTSQEAAMMHGLAGGAGPAVLFAVDDESDKPVSHGIDAARSGATIAVAGLALRAVVFDYPAVEIAAVPSLGAVVTGAVLVVGGFMLRRIDRDAVRPSTALRSAQDDRNEKSATDDRNEKSAADDRN